MDNMEKVMNGQEINLEVLSENLSAILLDAAKYNKGNKAAGRRVRTNSIKLEKMFKEIRKESIK